MSITRMKVTGRKGMGNITVSFGKDGKPETIQATGQMANLIARGMASDLGIKKINEPKEKTE
jgi:hypothetical protein